MKEGESYFGFYLPLNKLECIEISKKDWGDKNTSSLIGGDKESSSQNSENENINPLNLFQNSGIKASAFRVFKDTPMGKWISRDRLIKLFSPRLQAPPVGHYTPRYLLKK